MPTLDAESVDAIVSDPPYGLAFMGKAWDHGVPGPEFWREALRVAKPGAYLVAFGGTRTFHRLVVAIEDAGWDVRDQIAWVFGSGFPKSHNLDGAWDGWGTALKPAMEPICVARKPLVGTVARNVAAFGTGALNIDACRVAHEEECRMMAPSQANIDNPSEKHRQAGRRTAVLELKPSGRWPANLIHDGSDEVVAGFPATKNGGQNETSKARVRVGGAVTLAMTKGQARPGDTGSAARFFYCAKASRSEREAGLDDAPRATVQRYGEQGQGPDPKQTPRVVREAANSHPTVKPVALMSYLCRLVTPPNGLILDPFTGSGTTGVAAIREGFRFIGIEREAQYVEIARRRIADAATQPALPGVAA
jgi:site-specific DNA-methyltransferase (adenine-specific)